MRIRQRRTSGSGTTRGGSTGATGSPGKRTLTDGIRIRQHKAEGSHAQHGELAVPAGGGAVLPGGVQDKMERSFGTGFDDVRIHEGPQAEAVGAQAYAEGSDVHFAPGKYDPQSAGGQELLGHELAHVVQQRAGRVEGPQGKDGDHGINADPSLEAEADSAGALAARGEAATVHGATSSASGVQLRPMTQEEIEGAGELAEHLMRDVAEGVTLTYKGKGWSPGMFPVGTGDDLLMADLLDKLSALRSVEARVAVAAVRSVADHREMLGVEPMFDDKSGTHVELPASYRDDPPTDEVAVFVALHEAIGFVESLIVFKARELIRDSEGIYDDGMIETRSEHSDRKWAEVAAATLDGLTGTFGGVIGYAISSYLTEDPEVIAAATQFGENVTSTVGIVVGVDPVTGGKKGKQPNTKKGRKGGNKGGKRKKAAPGRGRNRPKGKSKKEPVAFYQDLWGKSESALLERGLAQGWKKQAVDRGTGWKLVDGTGVERLRFMRGKGEGEKVQWERMKNGYMRWKDEKGNNLDVNGKVVPKSDPEFDERIHIPYEGS